MKFTGTIDGAVDPFTVVHSAQSITDSSTVIEAVFVVVSKRTNEHSTAEANKEADNIEGERCEESGAQTPPAPLTSSVFVTTLYWLTLTTSM